MKPDSKQVAMFPDVKLWALTDDGLAAGAVNKGA